ncbi:MAG: TolC family protein [Armatimonadota bacterium]
MTRPRKAILRALAASAAVAVLLLGAGWACAEPPAEPAPAYTPPPHAAGVASPPTLRALIAEAEANSRELAALRDQIAAAEARAIAARALPDPMASAGLTNIPVGGISLDRDMMSGAELMLSRDITTSARRRLRGDIQQAEADALRELYTTTRSDLVREVTRAYIDLQFLDEALLIAEQNRLLAADVLAIAESQYSTGRAMQQDVFQSQVQLSRMVDSLILLRRQRAAAVARMNRYLYRPLDQALPSLPPLSASPAPSQPVTPEALQQGNSVLRQSLARLHQADRRLDLANQWRRPDYSLSFRYMYRQQVDDDPMTGDDMWGVSLGIGLPWLNRAPHEQEVKAARADRNSIEQTVQAQLNDLSARLEELSIEIARAEEQLSLVETGLLPQAEAALAATRSAYITGRTDAVNVLTSQLSLYNLQLERSQLLRDHEQNVAEYQYQLSGALQPQPMGASVGTPVVTGAGPAMSSAGGM